MHIFVSSSELMGPTLCHLLCQWWRGVPWTGVRSLSIFEYPEMEESLTAWTSFLLPDMQKYATGNVCRRVVADGGVVVSQWCS